jgi:hypothetical protein
VTTITTRGGQPSNEVASDTESSASLDEEGITKELEDEIGSTTELQELFVEITHIITCLYKFAITIQNPAPRDRFEKCASIPVTHYEDFDISHVTQLFPHAERSLLERLGRANSRRRQLLMYYERHHKTIARESETQNPEEVEEVEEDGRERSLIGSQRQGPITVTPTTVVPTTVHTQTTVSTFVERVDTVPDSGVSQTSYAMSGGREEANVLEVPPPPNPTITLGGTAFECPYCFDFVELKHGFPSWRYGPCSTLSLCKAEISY